MEEAEEAEEEEEEGIKKAIGRYEGRNSGR